MISLFQRTQLVKQSYDSPDFFNKKLIATFHTDRDLIKFFTPLQDEQICRNEHDLMFLPLDCDIVLNKMILKINASKILL